MPLPELEMAGKYGRGRSFQNGTRLLGVNMRKAQEHQQLEKPMPAALRADLVNHLANVLVCELREQNESKSMVESPGGTNQKAPNVAKVRAELGDDGAAL